MRSQGHQGAHANVVREIVVALVGGRIAGLRTLHVNEQGVGRIPGGLPPPCRELLGPVRDF